MSILLIKVLISLFTVFFYLFFYWRRLKDDYHSAPIFTTSITILLSTFISGYLATLLPVSNLWFWGAGMGFLLSFLILNGKYKFKFFENYEAATRSILIILSGAFLSDYFVSKYTPSLYGFLFIIFLFIVFIFIDLNYRKFTWYKSGRVGIAGLSILGLLFTARAIASAFDLPMISLLGRVDFILSGVAAFLHFFFVYNISES